jgi:hypothetical protein
MVSMISRLRARRLTPVLSRARSDGRLSEECRCWRRADSTITLTASATALPANGTTDIIAQVIEASGTPPHSGTHSSLRRTSGAFSRRKRKPISAVGRRPKTWRERARARRNDYGRISGGYLGKRDERDLRSRSAPPPIGKVTADANPTKRFQRRAAILVDYAHGLLM